MRTVGKGQAAYWCRRRLIITNSGGWLAVEIICRASKLSETRVDSSIITSRRTPAFPHTLVQYVWIASITPVCAIDDMASASLCATARSKDNHATASLLDAQFADFCVACLFTAICTEQ